MSAPDLQESSVATAGATLASSVDRVANAATRHERLLWGVVAFALVADVVLTVAGLGLGHTEGNPAMRWAIGAGGIGALVLAKLCIVGLGYAVARLRPASAGVVPLGLAIPWLLAAAINAVVIA